MRQSRIYCTYFDSGYLPRGLALIESLRRHGDDSTIWILALDAEAKAYLDALEESNVRTLTLRDLEEHEPALAGVRSERSLMEYYFTCTPQLTRYVMDHATDPSAIIVYLDADLYFFDDPQYALDAMGDGSIGIIEHRYPAHRAKKLAKYGRFNVGWVGFRADENGRACLQWWAERCLEWCYDRPEDGKYADQGYLDSFPRFDGLRILSPLGLNLAPWNTGGHQLSLDANSRVMIDAEYPLVFFHFHGVRQVGNWFVTSQLVYGSRLTKVLRESVYLPYLMRLAVAIRLVAPTVNAKTVNKRGNGWRGLVGGLRKKTLDRMTIITGNAISLDRVNLTDTVLER